MMRYLF